MNDLRSNLHSNIEALYITALRAHDWEHEHSDDQRVWKAGVAERKQLMDWQKLVDQDYSIWNEHCPKAYKR